MPTKKSAIKHLRQTKKLADRNTVVKDNLKKLIKKSRQLLVAKNKSEAETAIKQTIKAMDKATQNGVIKKNTASRTKSRLMKQLNKLS
ncbi:30S ribosomal protein S20 [Patescibacteria group bacterium]